MVLYLTSSPTGAYRGGEEKDYKGFDPANDMLENLKADWKEDSRCLMIAANPDAVMQNDEMRFYFEKVLRDSELSISGLDICDSRNGREMANRLADYDMIILGGGHVPTQNAFFHQIGLPEKIRDFAGIVMGISAGSMNCAEVVYAQPELAGESISSTYQRYIAGLGLTQCNVLPHYQAVKDDMLDGRRLMEDITYADSFGRKFYAIPDGSYILQRKGAAEIHGEAYLISEGEIRQICTAGQVYRIAEERKISDSELETIHLVRMTHLNSAGRLFGGILLQWIDEVAALVAKKHSRMNITTASIDHLQFLNGAYLGDAVVLRGKVTYVGRTSMDVKVETYAEDKSGARTLINCAYITEVALDREGKPAEVPRLILETQEDKTEWAKGEKRRALRVFHK